MSGKSARVGFEVEVDGRTARVERSVPSGTTDARALLPIVRDLADAAVTRAVARAAGQGKSVSCRAGCGACCRQVVPVGRAEAARLREVVEALPEREREEVRSRFERVQRRLRKAGLAYLATPAQMSPAVRHRNDAGQFYEMAFDYWRAQIACPFLVNERCSIYSERPVTCREHVVTSPAQNCARPDLEGVQGLGLNGAIFEPLAAIDAPRGGEFEWVPLPFALDWRPAQKSRTGTGPALFKRVLAAVDQGVLPQSSPRRRTGDRR